MSYSYKTAMYLDIRNYILENDFMPLEDETREDYSERLFEELWVADSVTGNASGSYTFNRWQAMQYVMDNMDLLTDCVDEMGYTFEDLGKWFYNQDFETMDVIIRCSILSECISETIDEMDDSVIGLKPFKFNFAE